MHRHLLVVVVLWSVAPTTSAQEAPGTAVVLVSSDGAPPPGRMREFATHVERAARVAGYDVVREPAGWAEGRVRELGAHSTDRVDAFRRVERLLVAARANTAGLMEGRALAELEEAARLARSHADVPGAAAWIAEVETAMGITAAQAGLDDLAADAFARAATLDPSRGVRGAEAPPAVVEGAADILAAVARRPRGSFEVRASAPGARVFLDDREIGRLPRIVRAPVGTHVLRVEAPGRSPWGQVLGVLEGGRPPVVVELAPDPLVSAARRLIAATRRLDPTGVDEVLDVLGVDNFWMVSVGGDAEDRALLVRCDGRGCESPRRLALDDVPFVLPALSIADSEAFALGRRGGDRWLAEPVVVLPPPPTPWWRRWYVWVGVGALLSGVIAAVAVAAQPPATQSYEVYISNVDEILMPGSMP